MAYWTRDFMAYLESELIERIKVNNPYCQNVRNMEKNKRDMNKNADKEDFATNIINLIVEVFMDVSYCSYLLPEENKPLPLKIGSEEVDIDR